MKCNKRETDSEKYLVNVLQNWKEFCRTHQRLARAIRELLNENKRLKQELKNKGN